MNKKILFIINPISGVGKQKTIEKLIDKHLNLSKFQAEIKYTEYAKHAAEISKNASTEFDIVVVVGGDGSVNEVSSGLINTKAALAVIPTGSGNGFARFMKIPLNLEKAIQNINTGKIIKIDTALINQVPFVNVSGIGFDAKIGHQFAQFGKRGFLSYLKIVACEFHKYKCNNYILEIDGKKIERDAFLISMANTSQFGNNAHIAPKASVRDGLLDIVILRKFPLIHSPALAIRLFAKNIDKSNFIETFTCKEINISADNNIQAHIDGEPYSFEKSLSIKINPLSLNVIC